MLEFEKFTHVVSWWAQANPQVFDAAEQSSQVDFQSYIFWAYGLACLLLLFFTIWSVAQIRVLARRVDELESRASTSTESKSP